MITRISNKPITRQQLNVFRPVDMTWWSAEVQTEHQKEGDWSDSEWSASWSGGLVQADKKATVTWITTCYNHGLQKSISKCTCQTLRERLHQQRTTSGVSGEQETEATISTTSPKLDNSRMEKTFLLQNSHGHVNIIFGGAFSPLLSRTVKRDRKAGRLEKWHTVNIISIMSQKQPSTAFRQTMPIMGRALTTWPPNPPTLGPWVLFEHRLNTALYTAFLSIVADHVHAFMTTVITHYVTKLRLVSWTW